MFGSQKTTNLVPDTSREEDEARILDLNDFLLQDPLLEFPVVELSKSLCHSCVVVLLGNALQESGELVPKEYRRLTRPGAKGTHESFNGAVRCQDGTTIDLLDQIHCNIHCCRLSRQRRVCQDHEPQVWLNRAERCRQPNRSR